MSVQLGPNARKLMIVKMSRDAIPDGGGLADGIDFFMDKEKRHRIMVAAEAWTIEAIQLVRTAADPNPWWQADDEAIAGELLRKIDEKKGQVFNA